MKMPRKPKKPLSPTDRALHFIVFLMVLPMVIAVVQYFRFYMWLGEFSGMNDLYRRQAEAAKTLPVTIGTLTDWPDEDYSSQITHNLTGRRHSSRGIQKKKFLTKLEDGQPKTLNYTVTTDSANGITAYMQGVDLSGTTAFDVSQWKADEGYYEANNDGTHRYVINWGTRVIAIEFGWEPTEEQLDTAVTTLMAFNPK